LATAGDGRIMDFLERALGWVEADQAEVVLRTGEESLTRYANNAIHQNVAEKSGEARIRAVLGRKVGLACTGDLSEEGIKAAAREAVAIARLQPDNPDFKSLVSKEDFEAVGAPAAPPAPPAPVPVFAAPRTAEFSPEDRADAVKGIIDRAKSRGLVAAGAYTTAVGEIAIGNTLGVRAHTPLTSASLTAVVMSETGSGYADSHSRDVTRIDPSAVAIEAVEKCLANREPVAIDPGEFEVILEEYAVAELTEYLNYLGFGARSLQEGHSFMSGMLGRKVMDSRVTIHDDGLDPVGNPLPFDLEGVPKQQVTLIDEGVARDVVWDSFTAGREKRTKAKGPRRSTGHAMAGGPFAQNLFMAAGSAQKQQMVADCERGLLITRFHYVRAVHPTRTVITGMTRDGTFLVEHGKIIGPVKNFRFTQSITEAFSDVRQVGRTRKIQGGMFGAVVVPAMHLGRFNFTGRTEH
jgi:predicted Zn-dependent protease